MNFRHLIFYCCTLLAGMASQLQAQPSKTLLAIFPHPDDETAIGEVLVKYAALGYRVQLIIATDGKNGTRVTKIPAGDSLGNLRQEESRCGCRAMGLPEPIFLGIERLDTREGVGNYFKSHRQLRDSLVHYISSLNPDIILSFGPDGDTHHAEHIVTGAAVTEVLLRRGWVDRYPLYYLAWTKKQSDNFGLEELGYVADSYLNVRIDYSQEEELKALEAFRCYRTQFTDQEMEEDRARKLKDKENYLYFRRFVAKSGVQQGF